MQWPTPPQQCKIMQGHVRSNGTGTVAAKHAASDQRISTAPWREVKDEEIRAKATTTQRSAHTTHTGSTSTATAWCVQKLARLPGVGTHDLARSLVSEFSACAPRAMDGSEKEKGQESVPRPATLSNLATKKR
jgi:hypothetical protein